VQALIDLGYLTPAERLLEHLVDAAKGTVEEHEARALLGRVSKQIYINNKASNSPRYRALLERALNEYLTVYGAISTPRPHAPGPPRSWRPRSRARRRPAAGRGARARALRGHTDDRARGEPRPQLGRDHRNDADDLRLRCKPIWIEAIGGPGR
jgi:hypothetical protein